jgi:hypothetical protein
VTVTATRNAGVPGSSVIAKLSVPVKPRSGV